MDSKIQCSWCNREALKRKSYRTDRVLTVTNYLPTGSVEDRAYKALDQTIWFCGKSCQEQYLHGM